MKLSVRKLEVTDAATLEKLVVEHIDGIEPGLAVIDSRLMLGHTTIDLVAQDASGSLVLVALGSRADESMLLRIVDAYSWCLEYPEAVQRHYPSLAISEDRPPRVVFVMSRVPESFQRKIKQLSFPAVDAVEFHQIEVNGVPTVFFDPVSRIRRGASALTSVAAPAVSFAASAAPVAVATPVAPTPDIAVRPEPVRVAPEPVRAVLEAMPRQAEPVRLGAELSALLGSAGNAPRPVDAHDRAATSTVATLRPETAVAAVEDRAMATAIAGGSDAPTATIDDLDVETETLEAPRAMIEVPEAAMEVEAAVETVVATAATPAAATAEPEYPFSEAERATKIAKDLGIQLPAEGALSRQWIDFLNQMAAK